MATVSAIVGATAILALPLALDIPYGLPPSRAGCTLSSPPRRALVPQCFRLGSLRPSPVSLWRQLAASTTSTPFEIDVLAPAKMLFTIKRGLFIWTPLTFFGVVGYLLLLRREPRHRVFLVGLGLSALALLLVHIVWGGFWAGGFSFSQRFLTALFPLFVIGIAELLARTKMLVDPAPRGVRRLVGILSPPSLLRVRLRLGE